MTCQTCATRVSAEVLRSGEVALHCACTSETIQRRVPNRRERLDIENYVRHTRKPRKRPPGLSDEQIQTVVALAREGELSQAEIGRTVGRSQAAIYRIVAREFSDDELVAYRKRRALLGAKKRQALWRARTPRCGSQDPQREMFA